MAGSSESHNTGSAQASKVATQDSHTAADFIETQLQLEADAREALPYKFDTCTYPLGPLRQLLFACMTCNPPPSGRNAQYSPAAVCYSCSVSCHGEHTLVELFNKRNFVCDCGTTRMPKTSPCSLRLNSTSNTKGGVIDEEAEAKNEYNQNFKNRFCGCACDYDAEQQKGTMFQCLGIGSAKDGGCGEDWWHPACIVGLGPDWYEEQTAPKKIKDSQNQRGSFLSTITKVAPVVVEEKKRDEGKPEGGLLDTIGDVAAAVVEAKEDSTSKKAKTPQQSGEPAKDESAGFLSSITEVASAFVDGRPKDQDMADGERDEEEEEEDDLTPPGFPKEDDFEGFICYKCVEAHPWIKKYAGSKGFLLPVFHRSTAPSPEMSAQPPSPPALVDQTLTEIVESGPTVSRKRKAEDDVSLAASEDEPKRVKMEADSVPSQDASCLYAALPSPPAEKVSLFFKSNFRDHLCRCSDCFPRLAAHPQLLEEDDTYELPVSDTASEAGGSTVGSGSIYERGESVLKNVDRVHAIEGVMAYNQLKEKLTPFFKEFAGSGKAISAEDIKAHFAKMRGDDDGQKQAGSDSAK